MNLWNRSRNRNSTCLVSSNLICCYTLQFYFSISLVSKHFSGVSFFSSFSVFLWKNVKWSRLFFLVIYCENKSNVKASLFDDFLCCISDKPSSMCSAYKENWFLNCNFCIKRTWSHTFTKYIKNSRLKLLKHIYFKLIKNKDSHKPGLI